MFSNFGIKRKLLLCKKRHNNGLYLANKNSPFNDYTIDVFLFVAAIVSLVVTSIVIYTICKHTNLKSSVTSLALQQIREAGVVGKQKHVSVTHAIECTCKVQWYTICMLSLSILGIIISIILNGRKTKLFRGHLFSDAVKIMMFIPDAHYYVPEKLCRAAESIYLFKITGNLISEHITLKRNILWDVIELDWREVNMTLNRSKIYLPASVIIPLRDKFKIVK